MEPDLQKPPCDCGNPEASWHGDHCGRREYWCDACWLLRTSGPSKVLREKANNDATRDP